MRIARCLEVYIVEAEGKTLLLNPERGTVEDAISGIGGSPRDKIIYDDTPLTVPTNPAEGTRVVSNSDGDMSVAVFMDGEWYLEAWMRREGATYAWDDYLEDVPTAFYKDEEILEILEPFEPGVITKQWAVGDVVPAGTVVGKAWVGRSTPEDEWVFPEAGFCYPSDFSGVKRTIEWIDS